MWYLQAHALVLQLPAALCAGRAAERVDHEGGLQGASAKSVVYRVASQMRSAGLPDAAAEGLSSVMVRDLFSVFTFWNSIVLQLHLTLHAHPTKPRTASFCGVMQVCTTDSDVKRALSAWAAYGSTSQPPIAAFNQGLPRKHTLVDLWGKAASSSRGSKKRNIDTSAVQGAPGVGETAAGWGPSKAASPAQNEQTVAANAADPPALSFSLQSNENTAAGGPPHVCPVRRRQTFARTSEDEQLAGSSQTQCSTENPRNIAGNRQESRAGAQPGQHRAVTDAFSVLLSSAKASAAAPAKEPAARPHGATHPRDGAWQDALHQIAMHPERWAHKC